MTSPYHLVGQEKDRFDFIANKQYKFYSSAGGWTKEASKQSNINYLVDIYFVSAKGFTFGATNLIAHVSIFRDFENNWTEAQSRLIYQQELQYPINKALSKYGADKFSGSTNRQKKIVYDSWIRSLDDNSIFASLRAGSLYKAFTKKKYIYLYSSGDVDFSTSAAEAEVEDLIDALGFVAWANANSPNAASNFTSVDDLETANAAQKATMVAIMAASAGVSDATPTEEEARGLRQCALLTDLMYKGYSYTEYPIDWKRGGDAYNAAFNGRIYPVTTDASFDPNSLPNLCFMPNDVQTFFSSTGKESNQLHWNLFWVYRDATGLQETQILKKSKLTNPNDEIVQPIKDVWSTAMPEILKESLKSNATTNDYTITNVSVTYDGTNPATARNDVKVEVTINMNHIKSLETICAYGPVVSELAGGLSGTSLSNRRRGGTALIAIKDLVTIPQDKSVSVVTPGGGNYFTGTYTPETSRIRLKVWSEGDIKAFLDDDPGALDPTLETVGTSTAIILDLSLIDHSITRDSGTNNTCTLVITYRGYFEEAMNAPYNDALTDSTIITNRVDRVNTLKEASDNKCSDNLIREMKRVIDEEQRIETQAFHEKGGLTKVMVDKGLIYNYEINKVLYGQGQVGTSLDPTLGNYITSITKSSDTWGTLAGAAKLGAASERDAANPEYYARRYQADLEIEQALLSNAIAGGNSTRIARQKQKVAAAELKVQGLMSSGGRSVDIVGRNTQNESFTKTAGRIDDKCFFLGDLMDVILDCLYQPGNSNHWPHTRDMNMRFIVGTISVPDPADLSKTININPLQIPIDLAFFHSWYHDTIVKKGIQHYAVGPFIKDLLERMINDVLYDTCFALLQLDESAPQLRSTFVTDHSGQWFKTAENNDSQVWYTPNLNGRKILMKKDIYAPTSQARNYCLIYQQYPSFFRQKKIKPDGPGSLKNNKNIPTLYDGYNTRANNFCDQVTFSKAENSKYLKEARYFNNSFGNLALLANVYNLSFKFTTKRMNTYMYPGTIVNFIVTDFIEGKYTPGDAIPNKGDPHIQGSLPNVLGLGGYFVITKVSYALTNIDSSVSSEISIDTRFIGTDARIPIVASTLSQNPFANEPANCVEDYETANNSLRVTAADTGINAQQFPMIHTDRTTNSYAAPLAHLPANPPSSTTTGNGGKPAERVPPPPPPRPTASGSNKAYDILKAMSYGQLNKNTKKSVPVNGIKYKGTVSSIDKDTRIVVWKLTAKGSDELTYSVTY